MYVACSTITWGLVQREPGSPYAGAGGYGRILDEVREAGYSHVDIGARPGSLQRGGAPGAAGDPLARPEERLRLLADHGLQPAPGFTGRHELHDPAARDESVESVRRDAAYFRALGLDAFFIVPSSSPQRMATAGHYPQGGRTDGPTDEQWTITCETLNAMGKVCRAEGVWLCLHNHVGTYWETEDECERVIGGTDPDLVALGPDVGHLVWGGIAPRPWFQRHMARVQAIHIKDIQADVARLARAQRWPAHESVARGVYTEIGAGCVDWPPLFDHWRTVRYAGVVTVDVDRPQQPTPAASVAASRQYLRTVIGI